MPNERKCSYIFGLPLAIAAAMIPITAIAQTSGEKQRSVGGEAAQAIVQPLDDLNLSKDDIPPALLLIQDNPYSMDGLNSCSMVATEIDRLNAVLGPDVDEDAKKTGVAQSALRAGGNLLGSFIPFRGIVRRLSGANAHRRKVQEAVFAGVTRRSFLKGYMASNDCAAFRAGYAGDSSGAAEGYSAMPSADDRYRPIDTTPLQPIMEIQLPASNDAEDNPE
ncbi:hypothetical protein ACFOWX_12380 [Sphingorhabdus arenilitoris]|uniref:Uncharacterized protein n=1 Tax=Sphingorhabdus arenilitoris TaxID=1490041 RepID=A0ABV8RJH4_9SPHN